MNVFSALRKEPQFNSEVPVSHYSTRSKARSIIKRVTVCSARVLGAWQSLQVSRRGRYSVERMLALDEYTRSTSLARVLFVCAATPLPMIAVVVMQESVPLAAPEDGWRANYGVWSRVAILGGAVAFTIVLELQHRVEGVRISVHHLLVLALCMAAAYTAIGIALAVVWVFPVPFIGLMVSSPGAGIFAGLLRVVCGRETWQQIVQKPELVIRLMLFLSAQATTAIIYKGYSAAFRAASNTYFELPLIMLLPAIKLVMKNVVARVVGHLEDLIPESVMFTVELFNTIYVAMCLQVTPSFVTVTVILTLDALHTIHALYGLHKQTANSLRRAQHAGGDVLAQPNFMSVAHTACQQLLTNQESNQPSGRIHLRSCTRHQLSSSQLSFLDSLEKVPMFSERRGPNVSMLSQLESLPTQRDLTVKAKSHGFNGVARPRRSSAASPAKVLEASLGALFTLECLVIAEYLEAVIPMVYGVYLLLIVRLPAAHYHGELDAIDGVSLGGKLGMVFLYGLLELASFALFAMVLHRNCRLNALYHLAFVLETHTAVVQTKLIVWMVALAGLQVPHFGKSRRTVLQMGDS
jgi:hypothetical protein